MRPTPSRPTRAWLAIAILASLTTHVRAEETATSEAAPAVRAVAEAEEAALDDAPSDEAAEAPAESGSRARSGARRSRWTDGPRRVPTPRGASMIRAQSLGLGTVDAAHELLRESPRSPWKRAAGSRAPSQLRWPVDIGAIGRGFGYVRHDRPEVRHNGIDIATPRGMVIRAAADGIVAYSDNGLRGYGNCVILVHANGWVTLYGHADRTTVQPGYRVRRGERIGFVGSTGRSDGPHLHFELRVNGEPVDPLESFEGEPWVEGRVRLAVLRRDHGGHRRDHLGEIQPDYGADTVSDREPARHATRTTRHTPAPASTPVAPQTPVSAAAPLPARIVRLLERGPNSTERAELRVQRVEGLMAPVRLDVATTYSESVLRYAVPTSTNVRAAAAGRVAYVGPAIREGMTTIVLIHTNGWVTLYAGVLDATVTQGALVAAGDRLGIVRDDRTGLSFELRSHGRPIDPRSLLARGPALVATRE